VWAETGDLPGRKPLRRTDLEMAKFDIGLVARSGAGHTTLKLALEARRWTVSVTCITHNLRFGALYGRPRFVRIQSGQILPVSDVPGHGPGEGLEPPRLGSREEPKARASTSSATPARRLCAAPLCRAGAGVFRASGASTTTDFGQAF